MAVGLCAVQFGVGPVGVVRGGVRREHRNRSRTATILETSVSDRGTIKGLTQIRLFGFDRGCKSLILKTERWPSG